MPALMKGHTWRDHSHKMPYPCAVEVKYDEIRCHVKVQDCGPEPRPVEFLSYAGKPLANMERFASAFACLARISGYHEFDCGFEVNGNFDDSYRWVRSTKKLSDDLVHASVKFMLYDLPENTAAYAPRMCDVANVCGVWADYCSGNIPMCAAESHRAYNPEDVVRLYKGFVDRGLEGAMVKSLDHVYERRRSYDWLKLKPEEDGDGIIEAINMAHATVEYPARGIRIGDPLGRAGSVRVRMEDGSIAEPHGIAHDLGRDMAEHPEKYVGQWCEFKYMERDRAGGYRHPRFHRLREAK